MGSDQEDEDSLLGDDNDDLVVDATAHCGVGLLVDHLTPTVSFSHASNSAEALKAAVAYTAAGDPEVASKA